MAKIVVAGDAVVITSELKLEDIKTVKKYRPDALTLCGGEDGKEPIFTMDVASGSGSINKYGVVFGSETRDEHKLAQLTMVMPGVEKDVEEHVADKIGGAVMNLNKLEAIFPEVIAEINAEKAAIMDCITVAQ